MTRLAVLVTCLASPTALAAAGALEAWDVEGTPYAGPCTAG